MESTPGKRLTLEYVKWYVDCNAEGTELISDIYTNTKSNLIFKCVCGNEYQSSFSNFQKFGVFRCSDCKGKTSWNINKVLDFVNENGKGTKLISKTYNNIDEKMSFRCVCGKVYKTTFWCFKNQNKTRCTVCNGINYWLYKNTRQLFLNNGLTPIFEPCEGRISAVKKLDAINTEGYKVQISIDKLKTGNKPDSFSKFNPYTIENIHLYLKRYAQEYKLESNEYHNNNNKLKWSCSYEHSFEMSWGDFQSGKRCSKCSGNYRKTNAEFLKEVFDLVNIEYIVKSEFKGVDKKVKWLHQKCGNEYEATPYKFINAGQRCPRCNESKGEKKIREYLLSKDINFKEEYTFVDCINIFPLRFDFAIFDSSAKISFLIEYDGKQHFAAYEFYGGKKEFQLVKFRDSLKNEYCKRNNLKLLRIPYTEYDNVEAILATHL